LRSIRFHSDGLRINGDLYLPRGTKRNLPGVIHAVGWMSLKGAGHYTRYYERLLEAGIAVLSFNYRGFGSSQGSETELSLMSQVADVRAAVSYLAGSEAVSHERIGALGSGGTGGAVAIFACAIDERIRTVAALSPFANGRDWLEGMRRPYEWRRFAVALEKERRRVAGGGVPRLVPPFGGIVIPGPERRAGRFKADISGQLPARLSLLTADSISTFAPEDVVHRIAPRSTLVIACENDSVVPPLHAKRLYARAGSPRRLVWLAGTNSYASHSTHGEDISRELVSWFADELQPTGPTRVEHDRRVPHEAPEH
jgi:uncharacterized protein